MTDSHPYNPRIPDRNLKYYIFDWDDNILRMPTHIHLERRLANGTWVPHLVSTSLYAVIRNDTVNYRPPGGTDWERAFVEFRDFATDDESKFLTDARTAIDHVLAGKTEVPPSFRTFKKTLVEGRIFAIVTARGHKPETLRKGVEMFIDRILTDAEKAEMLYNLRGYIACYDGPARNDRMTDADVLANYLSLNKYHAVTSPAFEALVVRAGITNAQKSETRKQFAIRDFLEHLFHILERTGATKPVSVGFSDDDPANVRAVSDYITQEVAHKFPGVKFVVYDTSDPSIEKGRKIVVSGQMDLGLKL